MAVQASGGGAMRPSTLGSDQRLGRALFYVHRQAPLITDPVQKAKLGQLIAAGEAMDYVVKLKDQGTSLTGAMAVEFAAHAGISQYQLFSQVLPILQAADLISYTLDAGGAGLARIEEYVGLSGRVIDQAMRVTAKFMPTTVEIAVLHSAELASWAPLTLAQHAEQLHKRGFSDEVAREAVVLTLATGVNQKARSAELNKLVVYNPNVWSAHQAGIAAFLKSLPPAERDSLLGLCEQAANSPGLVIGSYSNFSSAMLSSARKVGLVQAATVTSSVAAGQQTFVFSPIMESEDDKTADHGGTASPQTVRGAHPVRSRESDHGTGAGPRPDGPGAVDAEQRFSRPGVEHRLGLSPAGVPRHRRGAPVEAAPWPGLLGRGQTRDRRRRSGLAPGGTRIRYR